MPALKKISAGEDEPGRRNKAAHSTCQERTGSSTYVDGKKNRGEKGLDKGLWYKKGGLGLRARKAIGGA